MAGMKKAFLACLVIGTLAGCAGSGSKPAGPPVAAKLSADGKVQQVTVEVEHGYQPDHITAKAGVPLEITFRRDEAQESCAKDLEFPTLDRRIFVKNNSSFKVTIPAEQAVKGTLPFQCTMNMMHGEITFQ